MGETTPNFHARGEGLSCKRSPDPAAHFSPEMGAGRVRSAGKVTRGDAPPPFVPQVGGGDRAKGPRKGNRHGGVDRGHHSPPLVAQGTRAKAPLSPTRARIPALGPMAVAAPMPSAGERLQSVAKRSAHPPVSGRSGRGGGILRTG